jgi:tetratricopeptide (TPR) repeat protein
MKKLILSLALVVFATTAFAQKKVVRSASSNFKKGALEVALEEVNAALTDAETKDDPTTMLLKAQIETKMFSQDDDFSAATVSIGRAAFTSFNNTLQMVGGDATSKIGKEVWKEELPGMPENLRPYSLVSLKQASFDKAIQAYEDEDYPMSYEFFNLVSDIDPKDTTANFNAGYLAYTEMSNIEAAKKHFYRLLEVPEYDKLNTYYFLIQIASGDEKDPESAYKYVTMAKKDFPEDKTLSEFEVQLLLQMDKMEEAMISVQNALKDDPSNSGLLLRYGYLLEQSGDLEGALVQYRKAVEADPDFFEGNYYTGAIYLDRARGILAEVNNLSDSEWEKRAESMTKEADGLYRDAVPFFTKASELRPDNTEILEILFQVHTRLKNNAEAEKYNKRLIALLGEGWMER